MVLECTFLTLWSTISTIFVQIFVSEHVFLPNELSAKRLATCISNFSVEYHNFMFKKCSVFHLFLLVSLAPAV